MKQYLTNLPSTIGVYIFKTAQGEILYIGKSVNIKARVKSHFENAKLDAKERAIVENSTKIESIPTESEFKALVLESRLIQKYQPKYNSIWRDDKSYLYVKITVGEEYPKISLIRKSDISAEKFQISNFKFQNKSKYQNSRKHDVFFGPFSSRRALEQLLREIRRVIPFCTARRVTTRPCFYSKIGLCNPCPNLIQSLSVGVYHGKPHRASHGLPLQKIIELKKQYRYQIYQIIKILEGKTEIVLKDLRREMENLSKEKRYEEALMVRNRIANFEHLISQTSFDNMIYSDKTTFNPTTSLISFLSPYFPSLVSLHRIECYDVSNLSGREATAAMTVAIDGQIDKSQYRKFKIHSVSLRTAFDAVKQSRQKQNKVRLLRHDVPRNDKKGNVDWEMMLSVLQRRFKHPEWPHSDILIVDGGKPQVRMARAAMQELKLDIPVLGIAKNPDRLVIGAENMPTIRPSLHNSGFNLIRLLRDEAHRFGKKYHLYLRTNKTLQ